MEQVRLPRITTSAAIWGTRRWLWENVFPEPPSPPRAGFRWALGAGALAVAVAIQLARMWPSVPLNSLWAEDGEVWLTDAMNRGFLDALTTPYNGYLQTLSRLVAEPVARLPARWFAPAMALAGAVIVASCAVVVWRASAAYLEHRYLRAALAAMVVLLPVVGVETLDNVTNSMWFLVYVSFWLLLWRPTTLAGATAVAILLFLSAMSNAGVALLFPLWVLRLIAVRDRRDAVLLAAFAGGVAMQLGFSWSDLNKIAEAPSYNIFHVTYSSHWNWGLLPAYAQRIVGGALIGDRLSGDLWRLLGIPLEVALGAVLVGILLFAFVATGTRTRVLVSITVSISLMTFLFSGYERWFAVAGHRRVGAAGSLFLWPVGTSNSGQAHYMVVPALLLVTAVFAVLDSPLPRFASTSARTYMRVGVVLLLMLAALVSFNVGDADVRGRPTWSDALHAASLRCPGRHGTVHVTIAPSSLRFPWFIPLTCAKLRS